MLPRRRVAGSNPILSTPEQVADRLTAYLARKRKAPLRDLSRADLLALCREAFSDPLVHRGESGAARVRLGGATENRQGTDGHLRFGCDLHGVYAWWVERV